MNIKLLTKPLFLLLILFSLFHFFRDLSQNYHLNNFSATIFKMDKNWCGSFCNNITIPFELFILGSSFFVVKRSRVGLLGITTVVVFFIWIAMFLYDYFVFNNKKIANNIQELSTHSASVLVYRNAWISD